MFTEDRCVYLLNFCNLLGVSDVTFNHLYKELTQYSIGLVLRRF